MHLHLDSEWADLKAHLWVSQALFDSREHSLEQRTFYCALNSPSGLSTR